MTKTYTISEDGKSITCELCGHTSSELHHASQRYCPNCNRFHEEIPDHLILPGHIIANMIKPTLLERFSARYSKVPIEITVILLIVAVWCVRDFIRKVIL